jgi:hypothetical protein
MNSNIPPRARVHVLVYVHVYAYARVAMDLLFVDWRGELNGGGSS